MKNNNAGMILRYLMACVVALAFVFGTHTYALADSGNGTVMDMLKNQKSESKPAQSGKTDNSTSDRSGSAAPMSDTALFVDFLKIFFALAIVLALIYMLYRFAAKKSGRFRGISHLQNLGGVSVGANRSVQLIQMGDELMVIGVGDDVRLLKEIDDPEVVASLIDRNAAAEASQQKMFGLLNRAAGKAFGHKQKTGTARDDVGLAERLRGRLGQMVAKRSTAFGRLNREGDRHE